MLVYQRVSLKWLCMIKSPKALPGWNISGGLVRCLLVGHENPNRNAGNPPYRETRFFFFCCVFFCFLFGGPDANPMWWRHQSNLLRISMSQFYPTYGYFLINQHTQHESHMRLSENRVPRKFHCLHRALFSLLTVPSYPPFSDIPICI